MLSALALSALALAPCALLDTAGVRSVDAKCATLNVPENPDEPDGSVIALSVAVIHAATPVKPGEALTVIAGGPGGASTDFYVGFEKAFSRAARYMDVVLVDQRGTGASARMDCPLADPSEETLSPEAAKAASRECLAVLAHDPRFFTTSIAVRDLDAVREALGYEKFNVYGVSYGTRVAQHYARRYPAHTASIILDGVVPPEIPLGPNIPLNAQAALDTTFERCAEDAGCSKRFPGLAAEFAALRTRLTDHPMELSMPHPRTGESMETSFSEPAMAAGVRLLSYTDDTVALLPLLIHEAARDRPDGLAAQAALAVESLSQTLALGMHNSVVCTEDVPFLEITGELKARLEDTYLGFRQVSALQAMCEPWPKGRLDADLREPLASDVPALVLSGQYDPVTPPAYGELVASRLPNARHLVAPGKGHGVAASGCAPRLVAEFLRSGDAKGLDGSCLERLSPQPFFLDYSGPSP